MVFYRALIQSNIHLCGPKVRVTEYLRNVLNRYALANQIRCQSPPEPVWMDVTYAGAAAEILDDVLYALLSEAVVRILKADEQRRIVVGPAAKVTPEIFSADLREIETALFAALSDYGCLPGHEVNTGSI